MKKVNLSLFDTIIFDFGGVILDIDPDRSIKAFHKLYGEDNFNKVMENGILWELEKGKISPDELIAELKKMTKVEIESDVFIRAWNAMLVDYKPKRIERIQWLSKSHKLFMLSNTNEIHFSFFSKKLEKEYGVSFNDLFREVYLSNKMGCIKPDLEIYRQVLIEQKLMPEKTLFIEDTKENTDAAEKLGIETLLIPRNGSFYDYFE